MSEKEIKEEVVQGTQQQKNIVNLVTSVWGLVLGILVSLNSFFVLASNTRHVIITCVILGLAMQVFLVLGFWLSFAKLRQNRFDSKTIKFLSIGTLINFGVGFLTCFALIAYLIYFLIYFKNNYPDQSVYTPFIIAIVILGLMVALNAFILIVIDKFIKNIQGLVDGSETTLKQNKYCLIGCLSLKAVFGFVAYFLPLIVLPRLYKVMSVKDPKGTIASFLDLYNLNGLYYAAGTINILFIGYVIFFIIKLSKMLQEK